MQNLEGQTKIIMELSKVTYSTRVGGEVPGVVAVLCVCVYGWVGIAGPQQLNSSQTFNLLKQINNKQTCISGHNNTHEKISTL